jgi:DNA-binding GntR family transcriptional regulator
MPEIERTGPTLIYQQITGWMRQQISSGNWPEHFRLPSEIDLANELEVSRGTVRKAIRQMIDDGSLVSIHGKGTFVASSTLEQPIAEQLVGFSEALLERNIPYTTRVIRQELVVPEQRIVSLLAAGPAAPVFLLERVRSVRQTPVAYFINQINTRRCPGIETVDFTRYRLFYTLEETYHLELGLGQRTFQAQSADERVAEMLNISSCDPVMYMEQLLYLRDGQPIEFSMVWYRGNSFRLSSLVRREEKKSIYKNTILIEPA